MSHFTYLTTKMVELDFIKTALDDLGYEWEAGQVEVRGYRKNRTPAQLKIVSPNPDYDIGFCKRGNAYEIVADWWAIKGLNAKTFAKQLAQRYAYHATRAKLEIQGFALIREEQTEDGEIRLTLRRMA